MPEEETGRKKTSRGGLNRDIAFLQKKLAELEIAVSEVQETVQKVDTSELSGLKQRLEDVEDLTMVENAAVIELKNMLEGTQPSKADSTSPELEGKIAELEQKVSSIAELSEKMESQPPQDIQEKIDEMNSRITSLHEKIINSGDNQRTNELIANYRKELEALKKDMANNSLQTKVLAELEDIKNESLVNNSKVDAVDSFVKELGKDVAELKPAMTKIQNLERLDDMERTADEKLQSLRDALSAIERMKEGNEMGTLLNRVRTMEQRLSELKVNMDDFARAKQEIYELKKWKTAETVDVESYTETIGKIKKVVSNFEKEIERNEKLVRSVETDISVLQGNQLALEGKLSKFSSSEIIELKNRINSLEEHIHQEVSTSEMIEALERRMEELENKTTMDSTANVMDEIVSRLVFLESRIAALEGNLVGVRSYPIIIE